MHYFMLAPELLVFLIFRKQKNHLPTTGFKIEQF